MRRVCACLGLTACMLSSGSGCGSAAVSDSGTAPGSGAGGTLPADPDNALDVSAASAGAFDPPPPAAGYTRFVAPVVEGVEPGSDTTRCQYIQAPSDRDIDVLDVQGYQSEGGHHSVAYAIVSDVPVGTSRRCTDEDALLGGFLGGVGGAEGGGITLPEGVAFRLPKGSAIQLNTHFLNTSEETIDGHTVVDFRFVEADSDRTIASMFVNGTLSFDLPPNSPAEAMAECTMPQDMQFILFTNHMHDFGARASTELVHANGSVEMVHEDPAWTYEMQFKAVYSQWPLGQPLTVSEGDVVRTRCHWQNRTAKPISFPREMCFGIGFFLSDGNSSPACINGVWTEI